MKSILVFIDGTICDDRHRIALYGTNEFDSPQNMMKDKPVKGSVDFLQTLSQNYSVIYIGARSPKSLEITKQWIKTNHFPDGDIYLAPTQAERLNIVKDELYNKNVVAGIGDRWDDNQLHLEMGCLSIIVQEYNGDWDSAMKYISRS